MIASEGGFSVFDDDKRVRSADDAECRKACRDMYIIVPTRESSTHSSDSVDLSAPSDGHAAGHGHALAPPHAAPLHAIARPPNSIGRYFSRQA